MFYKSFARITASEPFQSAQHPDNRGIKFTIALNDVAGTTFSHVVLLAAENPMVARIGYEMLSQLCRAVGVMQPADSAELHGIEFIARYSHSEGDGFRLKGAECFARDRERIAYWLEHLEGRSRPRKLAKRIRRGDWE